MHIAIDLQGAQTESRKRGIGRYTLSLTKSIINNCNNHNVSLILNGHFPESIEHIRFIFDNIIFAPKMLVAT